MGVAGAALACCLLSGSPALGQPAADPRQSAPGASGLPVPRYVSLKSDRVHIRQGPGTDYKVLWVYRRAGLPVEVVQEFDGWRQVRDAEGTTGWVIQSLVSGRRTAVVMPWEAKGDKRPQVALLADDRDGAQPVAVVEAGVIASIRECDGRWCSVSVGSYRGYIAQSKLWGVYPNETIK